MPTLAGIDYAVSTENIRKGGNVGQGIWYELDLVLENWSDSDDFMNALLGLGTTLRPHQCPLATNAYAQSAVCDGFGQPALNSDGLPQFVDGEGIIIRTRYSTSAFSGGYQVSDDPVNVNQIDPGNPLTYCIQDLSYETELQGLPGENHTLKWLSDGSRSTIPLTFSIGLTTMVLSFPHVRAPLSSLLAAIRDCRNRVNGPGLAIANVPFLTLPANPSGVFLGAARGTVLFKGAQTKMEAATDGTLQKSAQLTFVEREIPYGQYVRGNSLDSSTRWDYVVDSSSNFQFVEADLRRMLFWSVWPT